MSIKKEPRKFNCVICGIECVSRDKRSKLCGSLDCQRAFIRKTYHSTLYPRKCVICGKEFEGKYHETVCSDECESKSYSNGSLSMGTIDVNFTCRYCGKILETVKKVKNWKVNPNTKKRLKTCSDCRKMVLQKMSEAKKGNKNPNWKEVKKIRTKYIQNYSSKEDFKKAMSDRMKRNNPMKNLETVKKVFRTRKQKIENGTLVFKKGINNPRWKGISDRKHILRTRLYSSWVKPVMERDGWKCTMCGQRKNLEVHHKVPFREILIKCLSKFNKKIKELTNEEFELLWTDVLGEHSLDTGISLCKKCHSNADSCRAHFEPILA